MHVVLPIQSSQAVGQSNKDQKEIIIKKLLSHVLEAVEGYFFFAQGMH